MSNISVDYDVLNQRGSPAWFSDIYANIPTAGYKGRMFISTDTYAFYRDTGTGWDLIGGPGTGTLTGSGVTGQVSFFNGTQTITGSNNLFWNNTNSRLGINTATPGAPLDIHGTGTLLQINGTGVGNGLIAYQQAGASKWTAGNFFDGTLNTFAIYNVGLVTNALTISSTTNNITASASLQVDKGVILATGTTTFVAGSTTLNGNANGLTIGLGVTVGPTTTNYAHQLLFPQITPQSYTFPASTGTIALTSNLSSYVPYTGATSSVDLGTNSITAIQLIASASGGNAPGYLLYYNSTLYASISSTATYFQFNSNTSAGYLFKNSSGTDIFRITNSGQIGNGINTYTLPSSNGTLALTSDLSSYLPLTGGTLTGQLYINPTNTATTGLDVASNTTRIRSDNLEGFKRQLEITMGSGTLVSLTAKGYGADYGTDMAFYTATTGGTNASPGIYITGTNNRVGIKTGTPSYDLDITGTLRNTTSAYFSTTSGSVGIGTASPSDKFNVVVSTNGNNARFDGPTSGFIVQTNASSVDFIAYGGTTPAYRTFNFATGANANLTISTAGNVGIGESAPTTKLQIVGINTTSANNSVLVQNSVGTTLMQVRNDGEINLGAYTYNNTTAGIANMYIGGTGIIYRSTASSIRFKENILNWSENGLATILALQPKIFTYKADYYSYPNRKFLGLIAEEVAEISPYLADYENEDGTGQIENVRYSNIVVPLIKAIQELNEKLVRNNIN